MTSQDRFARASPSRSAILSHTRLPGRFARTPWLIPTHTRPTGMAMAVVTDGKKLPFRAMLPQRYLIVVEFISELFGILSNYAAIYCTKSEIYNQTYSLNFFSFRGYKAADFMAWHSQFLMSHALPCHSAYGIQIFPIFGGKSK